MSQERQFADVDVELARAAKDCVRAKRLLKEHEELAATARMEMEIARDQLLALEMDKLEANPLFIDLAEKRGKKLGWLDLAAPLVYPAESIQGAPMELQIRARDSVAKGTVYTPADQARVDEYRKTIKAIEDEIAKVPVVTTVSDPVRTWAVWLVEAKARPAKPKKK